MFNAICRADRVEPHGPLRSGVPIVGLLTKLDAVVGQYCVDLVWHGFQHALKKLSCRLAVCFVHELRSSELAGSVNGCKK